MLEAAEEREQEFDAERQRWSSGDFTYEKVQQCIEDLQEERKRVTVLQENCAELQEKLHQRENCNLLLQKKLDELQNEQKLDSKERETREDDLYSTVDSLRSKSEKLQEEVQTEKSVIRGLANEKAELLAKVETLEEQLKESIRVASDLQQECDVLKEKLEGLKKDNDRLLKENDATLVSKSEEKLNFEDANRKLQELREGLEKEVKEKRELSIIITELENTLDGIINKRKDLEEKLKQAEEKMAEMSESHQVELESVKFTLYRAESECIALQEENEDLKRSLTGRTERQGWNNEKNCLLQELEEVKMRYDKASKERENLEGEMHKLNIKVMSLEDSSASAKDAAAEIESLKIKVKKLSEELEKEKNRADEKEKEANEMLESSFQLVKKHKKIVREKESLESRFKIACEKLNSMKAAMSREEQDEHSSNCSKQSSTASEVSLPKTTSSTINNPAVLLSPLARSLSNLEIKSVETVTSVMTGKSKQETSDTSQMTCQSSSVITPPQETESSKVTRRERVVNSSNLPQPRKRQSVATGSVLPKPAPLAEHVDSKKRLNQEGMLQCCCILAVKLPVFV